MMFFEMEMISIHLLEVLELKQRNVRMFNSGRKFNALSFRYAADTALKTKHAEYHLRENVISYVPAGLDYERAAKEDELIVVHFDAINCYTGDIEFFVPEDPARLAELFRKIRDLWIQKEPAYQLQCTSVFYEILAECYAQNSKPKIQNSKIQRSVDYMIQHYRERELTIGKLAEQSFMSEVYFRKLFKEEFGTSPQKYLMNLRMQNAVGLISSGYYSLKEVCDLSGYSDYKYFSVEFKKAMGVSPSEYFYRHYNK